MANALAFPDIWNLSGGATESNGVFTIPVNGSFYGETAYMSVVAEEAYELHATAAYSVTLDTSYDLYLRVWSSGAETNVDNIQLISSGDGTGLHEGTVELDITGLALNIDGRLEIRIEISTDTSGAYLPSGYDQIGYVTLTPTGTAAEAPGCFWTDILRAAQVCVSTE